MAHGAANINKITDDLGNVASLERKGDRTTIETNDRAIVDGLDKISAQLAYLIQIVHALDRK
jgi:hypothetical protein